MSHVDEGALHAYLDGALDEYPATEARRIRDHLDACSACAERLEAERGLRSDAHAMLGLAAPAVDMPSFEELRAYVERTRPATSRTTVRVTRLSWAASVMLALGVGWILRGG
ncbi:MAG: anti-sigma factor family protein, partial [Longimicrobiales bacterium]